MTETTILESRSSASRQRYRKVLEAGLTAIAGKGIIFLTSAISVPLTISYLGPERYGVWITITTLLSWFTIADLGLGNSLTNALSAAIASGDHATARQKISNSIITLSAISVFLIMFTFLVTPLIQWQSLLNASYPEAQHEISLAIRIAFVIVLINVPLSIVNRVLAAHQEGSIANIWSAAGNISGFAAIVAVTLSSGDLTALVFAFSGVPTFINLVSAIWLFRKHKPWLMPKITDFQWTTARQLSIVGIEFFILQIAGIILFQTDNLVVVRFLGPEQVGEYSITYRLFNYISMIHALLLTPLWPAYRDALIRNDHAWILSAFKHTLILGMAAISIASALLVVFGNSLLYYWTKGLVQTSPTMLILMASWIVLAAWGYSFSFLLNGLGQIRAQTIAAAIMAVLNLSLSIAWVQSFGLLGVIGATVISYLVTSAWIQPFALLRIIRHGRWITNEIQSS